MCRTKYFSKHYNIGFRYIRTDTCLQCDCAVGAETKINIRNEINDICSPQGNTSPQD